MVEDKTITYTDDIADAPADVDVPPDEEQDPEVTRPEDA